MSNTGAVASLAADLMCFCLQPVLKHLHDTSCASLLQGPVAVGDVCAANVLKLLPRMLAEGQKGRGLHCSCSTGHRAGGRFNFTRLLSETAGALRPRRYLAAAAV